MYGAHFRHTQRSVELAHCRLTREIATIWVEDTTVALPCGSKHHVALRTRLGQCDNVMCDNGAGGGIDCVEQSKTHCASSVLCVWTTDVHMFTCPSHVCVLVSLTTTTHHAAPLMSTGRQSPCHDMCPVSCRVLCLV